MGWIDATSGEEELGPAGAVGAGGEECAAGTCEAGTGSEAWAANIVMWSS